jgi:hypothetical protein
MSDSIKNGKPACVVMDTEIWDGAKDYFLSLPPHISVHAQQANDACVQFQIDVLGKGRIGAVKGSLTPHGSFAAMAYCDSPRDKLVLLSTLNEVAMFYDGKITPQTLSRRLMVFIDCDLPPADEASINKTSIVWRHC